MQPLLKKILDPPLQLRWQFFPNACLWRRSLCSNLAGLDSEKLYRATFICQYGLFCCMALVSFRLFSKNLGNLEEFFGQMDYRPPWQKIARTPMLCRTPKIELFSGLGCLCLCGRGEGGRGIGGIASHTKPHTKHFDLIFCRLLSSFLTLLYSSTLVLFSTIFDS